MGDLLDSIFSFLGDTVVAQLETFVLWLYSLIVQVFFVLYQLMFLVFQFLWNILVAVGNFFSHLWNSFFKVIFQNVWNAIKAAQSWLESHLQPIIDFLQRVRKLYDAWFNTYIRPILNMLQRIRQFLQLLSLLHIQIAAQLDNILAQVENKIASTFLQFRAVLNGAVDLLTLIADPTLLLRKPMLIISLRRTLPAIIRGVTGLPPGYFFPSPKGSASKFFAPVPANFNPADATMNPPISFYLSQDDGTGNVAALQLGFAPADSVVDEITMLDFFDNTLYPVSACANDPANCLIPVLQRNIPPQ